MLMSLKVIIIQIAMGSFTEDHSGLTVYIENIAGFKWGGVKLNDNESIGLLTMCASIGNYMHLHRTCWDRKSGLPDPQLDLVDRTREALIH